MYASLNGTMTLTLEGGQALEAYQPHISDADEDGLVTIVCGPYVYKQRYEEDPETGAITPLPSFKRFDLASEVYHTSQSAIAHGIAPNGLLMVEFGPPTDDDGGEGAPTQTYPQGISEGPTVELSEHGKCNGFDPDTQPKSLMVAAGRSRDYDISSRLYQENQSVKIELRSQNKSIADDREYVMVRNPDTFSVDGIEGVQETTSMDLYIDDKKARTGILDVDVKKSLEYTVRVYAISADMKGDGYAELAPNNMPTIDKLKEELEKTWEKQANVYLKITEDSPVRLTINYDLNGNGGFDISESEGEFSEEETFLLNRVDFNSSNISIFYLDSIKSGDAGVTTSVANKKDNNPGIVFIQDIHPPVSAQYVAAHECGHALGVKGDYEEDKYKDCLMYKKANESSSYELRRIDWNQANKEEYHE